MPHTYRAELNPAHPGVAEHTYKAKGTIRSLVAAFTATATFDAYPRQLHPGDEIRIYDADTDEAVGGLRPDKGRLVWHPFMERYKLENL